MAFFKTNCALALPAAVLLHAAPAWAANLSGIYVASSDSASFYLQLVESPDGRIVGRFKQVSIGRDHKLSTLDVPVSGATHNEQFVGKLEAGWMQGGDSAISGRRIPGGIQITGAGGLRASLRPGTEDDEARAVERLQREARRAIAAADAQRDHEKNVQALQQQVEMLRRVLTTTVAYAEDGSYSYRRFTANPARYEGATSKLESILANIKATPGRSGEAMGRRSQLDASMMHTTIDQMEHPQIEVQRGYEASMRGWKNLESQLAAAQTACGNPPPSRLDTTAFNRLCAEVPKATELLATAGERSKTEYGKIHGVYQQELAKQKILHDEARKVRQQFEAR